MQKYENFPIRPNKTSFFLSQVSSVGHFFSIARHTLIFSKQKIPLSENKFSTTFGAYPTDFSHLQIVIVSP